MNPTTLNDIVPAPAQEAAISSPEPSIVAHPEALSPTPTSPSASLSPAPSSPVNSLSSSDSSNEVEEDNIIDEEIELSASILLELSRSSCSPKKRKAESMEETSQEGKKKRQRTTTEQLGVLEKIFQTDKMPNQQTRLRLAEKLGMSSRRVQIWFQNKRAKVKRMSLKESDDTVKRVSDHESADDSEERASSPVVEAVSIHPAPVAMMQRPLLCGSTFLRKLPIAQSTQLENNSFVFRPMQLPSSNQFTVHTPFLQAIP